MAVRSWVKMGTVSPPNTENGATALPQHVAANVITMMTDRTVMEKCLGEAPQIGSPITSLLVLLSHSRAGKTDSSLAFNGRKVFQLCL